MDQEAIIRSIGISSTPNYMLLLGSGGSASSGVPTSNQCIWQWKRDIYLSANTHIPKPILGDVNLPHVQMKIQKWLDAQGNYPFLEDSNEYSFYIENTFPRQADRKEYFEQIFNQVEPQIGYKILAMLLDSMEFQWIWTTNFDGLVLRARRPHHKRTVKEIGVDTSFRIDDINENDDSCYIIQLHGDYKYDRLKNTDTETQNLEERHKKQLIEKIRKQPLIVIGYSGRDNSIMTALEEGIKQKISGGAIYWCSPNKDHVSERVKNMLSAAQNNGYDANIVEISGFDDFMLRLGKYVYRQGEKYRELEELLSQEEPERSAFTFKDYKPQHDWIKSNAFPIQLPSEIYQFQAQNLNSWEELRSKTRDKPLVASLLKGNVLVMGSEISITESLSPHMQSHLQRIPLTYDDFKRSNTVVMHICLQALRKALAEKKDLKPVGRKMLWNPRQFHRVSQNGVSINAYDAVRLDLVNTRNQTFLTLNSDVFLLVASGSEPSVETRRELKRKLLRKQYNNKYFESIANWRNILFEPGSETVIRFPSAAENPFTFRITTKSAEATLMGKKRLQNEQIVKRDFGYLSMSEPHLEFNSQSKDVHALRGLQNYGPYDLEFTKTTSTNQIKLGVICPKQYDNDFREFLLKLNKTEERITSHKGYLIPYPGFSRLYDSTLFVPTTTDTEWRHLPPIELDSENLKVTQRKITNAIIREIDTLAESASVDVIMIFVPSDWGQYRLINDENVYLNLHDFVKAYCVQKGIRTQFIEESTLATTQMCQVQWWLSQAVYAKCWGTPYVLESNDPNTVFVGIGYGMNLKNRDFPVVIGCSHIYDAAGRGLRYTLSQIRDPIMKRKNPYLKHQDALRIGQQIRQLFYETYEKLPTRVVIHKRTPFRKSEREGLSQALSGVKDLEMLTIEKETSWRFLNYNIKYRKPDLYPVERGTALITEPYEFFLWIHGKVNIFGPKKTYYQGGYRIPAPLKVKRYAGHAPIEKVAKEILGLSKMDLNNMELYNKMPATLQTSGAIARIGKLLARTGKESYDYRLFM